MKFCIQWCLACLLLTAMSAPAAEPYQVRTLSEKELRALYLTVLRDACRVAEAHWKTSAFDPQAGYWGDGVSEGNQGIRTVASMTLPSAVLARYDSSLTDAQRAALLSSARAGIRYATATHLTGAHACMDKKKWGGSWQSGMWTGTLVYGAWLIWDKLDTDLQHAVERVVASEDDWLASKPTTNNLWLDTKAEENGWEVPCLVLGDTLFSNNPHAALWHETAERYMMNTLCTAADLTNETMIDGHSMREWVKGANLQPDYTLENHNIFHPSYVGCSTYFMTEAAMFYTFAHRSVQAATHHVVDVWNMFQRLLLPTGESVYPQGMDWELHGLPFLNLYATLATRGQDAAASRLEQSSLQYIRAWQEMKQGDMAIPGSRLGITRHSICAEQAAFGFLAHEIFGKAARPLSNTQFNARERGVVDHPYLKFVTDRSDKMLVSFSWKNRVMGQVWPISDHEGAPFFTVPMLNEMVGSFECAPRGDAKVIVETNETHLVPGGFVTSGTLLLNGGRLREVIRVECRQPDELIYEDRVTAVSNVTMLAENGFPLAIENDEISGGHRAITDASGDHAVDWNTGARPFALSGNWVNIDGRVGVIALSGHGFRYEPATGYLPGISVGADVLYGSSSHERKSYRAGQEVAHRKFVVLVETSAKRTAKHSH